MKSSNNYMADILTKNLAAEKGEIPATLPQGLEVVKQFLDRLGIQRTEYHLISASGYSQQNMISPATLCKVLTHLKNNIQVSTAFLSSLPIAGVDGTLRRHMRRSPARGRIHAKTGYIDGATGLAGFIATPDGHNLTFALIYNGRKPAYKVKQVFDQICIDLVHPS